ncbi:MAG TPA: hypothetical protein VJR28_00940 [Chthoniobacterales bacterium]|nr:hypothetical protein [Chthoniobacterales bacterium]
MSDPRNVAHAKKVVQEKHHQEAKSRKPKKGKKSNGIGAVSGLTTIATTQPPPPEPKQEKVPGEHEKSVAVLSKLKDMEFHSKANIETLAQLTLTIEDELKQKEFSNGIGDVYSAQDSFHTKLGALIQTYEAKCDSLKPSA